MFCRALTSVLFGNFLSDFNFNFHQKRVDFKAKKIFVPNRIVTVWSELIDRLTVALYERSCGAQVQATALHFRRKTTSFQGLQKSGVYDMIKCTRAVGAIMVGHFYWLELCWPFEQLSQGPLIRFLLHKKTRAYIAPVLALASRKGA